MTFLESTGIFLPDSININKISTYYFRYDRTKLNHTSRHVTCQSLISNIIRVEFEPYRISYCGWSDSFSDTPTRRSEYVSRLHARINLKRCTIFFFCKNIVSLLGSFLRAKLCSINSTESLAKEQTCRFYLAHKVCFLFALWKSTEVCDRFSQTVETFSDT